MQVVGRHPDSGELLQDEGPPGREADAHAKVAHGHPRHLRQVTNFRINRITCKRKLTVYIIICQHKHYYNLVLFTIRISVEARSDSGAEDGDHVPKNSTMDPASAALVAALRNRAKVRI